MYSAPRPNGAEGATINPAALNSADLNRGMKRSRSPDYPLHPGPVDDEKPRKRGRPMKNRPSAGLEESQGMPPMQTAMPVPQAMPPQTPQSHAMPLPLQSPHQYAAPPVTPSHASPPPPKPTPKSTLKALPTVRDHTTDQLGPGGNEYMPRETDEAGEKKVMPNGALVGSREYRIRTFLVAGRGEKLFMLATECARVLGYRDSYLLFNKNRSLYKIIANQVEKDDLVNQDILPFSYRSRQIAIVTARSMFRQFGSRVIQNGRRVRDDYWESKARKQGFTENDLAGEKRPGGHKAREAAEASQNAAMLGAPHGEIVYSNVPSQYGGAPQAPLVQPDYADTRRNEYPGMLKAPRQALTGQAYEDNTKPSAPTEILGVAHLTADQNRTSNQSAAVRGTIINNEWRRTHEQPASAPSILGSSDSALPPTSRAVHQAHTTTSGLQQPQHATAPQPGVVSSQSPQMMMTAPPYSQPLTSQTQMQPRLGSTSSMQPGQQPYPYSQSTLWPPQTPQTPQYSYSTHQNQSAHSPHQQQQPQQQQQQQPPQQMRQQQQQQPPGGQVQQGGAMPYSGMPGMTQGYTTAGANHGLTYDQTPRQYMHQAPAPSPAVTQAWSGQPQTTWQGHWPSQPQ